ncbi:MAG: GNAT family N-acetyltransferase [Desulfuromonadales bacterium]
MTVSETGVLPSSSPAAPRPAGGIEVPANERKRDFPRLSPAAGEQRKRIRLQWLTGIEGLKSQIDGWDDLALQSPQRLPMLSGSWALPHLEAMLAPGDTWECALAFDAKELVGALPLITRGKRLFGCNLPLLRTPFDPHTRSGDVVVKAGYEESALPAMLQAAVLRHPDLLSLQLRGVVEDSPTLTVLNDNHGETRLVRQSAGYGCYLPITGNPEDLQRRLSAKFRSDLRNARRKLEKMGRVEHVCFAGGAAAADHLQNFLVLEASGWKGRMGTAIVQDPILVRFYADLARRMADRGWLQWHFLRLDGRAIAAEMTLHMGRALFLLKMAYDENLSRCAPGNVLFLAVADYVHRQGGVERIDCLTDMPWHGQWKMARREYFDLFLYPRRFLPTLAGYTPHRNYLRLKTIPLLMRIRRRIGDVRARRAKRAGTP